ncbi:hypothetical protein SLS54_008553 [Diplodia seriata]
MSANSVPALEYPQHPSIKRTSFAQALVCKSRGGVRRCFGLVEAYGFQNRGLGVLRTSGKRFDIELLPPGAQVAATPTKSSANIRQRNLARKGGFLDEVVFLARTDNEEDLAWLDGLVAREPAYTRKNLQFDGIDYTTAYDICENGTMYIKMDDDLVFIEDHAIATIAKKKLEHPEYFAVAANVVNQPSLSWIHYRLGVVKPYFPELTRASPGQKETPIATTSFDAFSQGLWHWQVAAQQHYSFLGHLEENDLWKYKFDTLDYHFMRMGIQMMAIWGEDVIASEIHNGNGDDEYHFTEVMTKRTGRHAVVDGRALVSHYTFLPQRSGLAATDILQRYRAFADENICPGIG